MPTEARGGQKHEGGGGKRTRSGEEKGLAVPTLKLMAGDCSNTSTSRGPGDLGLLASVASRVDSPVGHGKLVDAQRGRETERPAARTALRRR